MHICMHGCIHVCMFWHTYTFISKGLILTSSCHHKALEYICSKKSICLTTYEWAMSYIWMCHVTHINAPCHTCEWVMSHKWTSHDLHHYPTVGAGTYIETDESRHTYEWVMSHTWMVIQHIWMSHVTHMNESCRVYKCECVMCIDS